jgi:hypothetical protein
MLNTYIKNKGHTQTIIHRNKQTKFNDIKWDSDYDGNKAKISIDADMNGNQNHFKIKLDNKDLANMLNMPTINIPIHKRLENDFNMNRFIGDPNVYKIEIPHIKQIEHINPFQEVYHDNLHNHNYEQNNPLIELLESNKPVNYLPSPLPNEEFIIPITIDKKSHKKLMSKRHRSHRHRHRRSRRSSYRRSSRNRNSSTRRSSNRSRNSSRRKYKTYRVYKKLKSSNRSLKSRNSTRSYSK